MRRRLYSKRKAKEYHHLPVHTNLFPLIMHFQISDRYNFEDKEPHAYNACIVSDIAVLMLIIGHYQFVML